jgi:hypothetical protein
MDSLKSLPIRTLRRHLCGPSCALLRKRSLCRAIWTAAVDPPTQVPPSPFGVPPASCSCCCLAPARQADPRVFKQIKIREKGDPLISPRSEIGPLQFTLCLKETEEFGSLCLLLCLDELRTVIERTVSKYREGKREEKGEEKVINGIPHAPYNAGDGAPAPGRYDAAAANALRAGAASGCTVIGGPPFVLD